jgi:hypothetical protein
MTKAHIVKKLSQNIGCVFLGDIWADVSTQGCISGILTSKVIFWFSHVTSLVYQKNKLEKLI